MSDWELYHKKVCKNSKLLLAALDSVIDGVVVTSPNLTDNPIVYVSKGFIKLTGYNEDEILGKNCRFMQGTDSDQNIISLMKRSISSGLSFKDSLINYKKNGQAFNNYIRIEPLYNESNQIEYFVGSQLNLQDL